MDRRILELLPAIWDTRKFAYLYLHRSHVANSNNGTNKQVEAMKIKPFIHPITPTKLKTAFRRASYKFHTLAKARGINVKYVHGLIHYGKEPTDQTEHGRNIRAKLFLPKKRRERRQADCNKCGKPVLLTTGGKLQSHVHPDGTYCKGSFTRNFLPSLRIRKQYAEPPEYMDWWRKQPKQTRHEIIIEAKSRRTDDQESRLSPGKAARDEIPDVTFGNQKEHPG